jgi:glycerol-1-phosphate dehydrogenase [NAD(P)+]
MRLDELLGSELASAWPDRSGALPAHVFYAASAARDVARCLRDFSDGAWVAVLFDERTRRAAGEVQVRALHEAGWTVFPFVVRDRADGSSPICDDHTKEAIQRELPDVDAFVAVGGGVINDLTKWIAAEAKRSYAVMATALSMNGYAAANVAPTIRGIKTLAHARAPRIVAAIPEVVASAPHALTASGLGDLIAKPVSTADWWLNHVLGFDSFEPEIAAIVDRVEPLYLGDPAAVARHDPQALQALFEALVLSGCAMTLHGSSLPASGGEHLISHTLDMSSQACGVPHDLHGRQVGVATILVAALYEALLALEDVRFAVPHVDFDPKLWGAAAPVVEQEFRKKRGVMEQACEKLNRPAVWSEVRSTLRPWVRSAASIKECLRDAGAAHRLSDIGISRDRFLAAVRACGWMRARFTSVDLAACAGLLPGIEERLVDRWLT